MKRKRPKPVPAPWPLPKLLDTNRNAVTVYCAVRWLAGNRRRLSTTRATIKSVCGLSPKCISAAMTVLDAAGWVVVNYGRLGDQCWYRLSFPRRASEFFPVGRKTTHRKRKSRSKNDLQQTVTCRSKNDPPPLKRGKRGLQSAAPATAGRRTAPPEPRPDPPPTSYIPKPDDPDWVRGDTQNVEAGVSLEDNDA
jgi:hypothetical protein